MAGEPQAVGGISVPLTLDPSGWTAGLRRARADLEQLRREAAQLSSPAAQARRAPVTAGGVGVPAGVVPAVGAPTGNLAAVGGVSPRFNVTAGAVRDMRIEINRQLRTMSTQGEAVAIPVKLGRVPYSAFRQELSAGIGEVPVKITLDPGAIASLRGQVMRAIGLTAPGAGGPVAGIPRRATGGVAEGGRDIIVGEKRPEVIRLPPGVNARVMPSVTMADQMRQRQLEIIRQQLMVDRGTYPQRVAGGLVAGRYARSQSMRGLTPQQANFDANIMAAASRLQPHHLQGGIDWYRMMADFARQGALKYRVSQQTSVGVLAALSAGTAWESNKTKYERIMAAHAAGKPFPYSMNLDAHRKAQAILQGMDPERAFASSPKVGQFYRAGMGDLSSLVLDLWATRTGTLGGMEQPGRARPGLEAAFRKGAKSVGLQNAEFQAALWLLEKEEAQQAPGQIGMGFARGGRVPASGQMSMGFAPKFRRSQPFCTLCNRVMANPFDHNATEQHKANMRRRVGQGGIQLRERPYWMLHPNTRAELEDAYYEEQGLLEAERQASYPGDIWRPGRWSGGRARAYQLTLDQGGGTFDREGKAPKRGYAVGTAEGTAHLVDKEDRLGFTRAFRDIARSETPYVGTWLHEGQIHVDPAIVARRKKDALEIARRQRQIAYYDLAKHEDVYTERRERDPIPGQLSFRFAAGGRMRASQWGKIPPADPEWLRSLEGVVQDNRFIRTRKYNKPQWDEALDPAYLTRYRGDPHDKGPGSGHVYTDPMDPWMYHVTSRSNMDAIRKQGVQPQRGGFNAYGSINEGKRRSYWSRYPDPQWGGRDPVALAARLSDIEGRELDEIGELMSKKGVDPSKLFYLGANKRLTKLAAGGRMRGAGFVPGLRSIAQGYNRMVGLPPMQEQMLHPLFPDFSRRTAAAYERMPVGPDALSRRAYKAFGEETEAQYEYLQRAGFRFEPDPGDPYTPGPGDKLTKMQLAAQDVRRNKRLLAFSSALEHPLLTNEQNLKFRHVHDMMGHLAEGYSIGPRGEFNAAIKHSQMFTPLARMAMLAETHGQNSVVNFSSTVLPGFGGRSIADVNKTAPGTIYAQQKAQRLPDEILGEFYRLTGLEGRAGGGEVSEGYWKRAGGFNRVFGVARKSTPAGWAMTRLMQASMAEKGQPDIDLDAAMARLPVAMREPGMSRRALMREALGQTRQARVLAAQQFEPFQNPPMLPGQGGGKWIQIDPRWLPRERIDPSFLEKNAAGGPVSRSVVYGDPNGLHMRPASALAKVGQMAQLSGNPITVMVGDKKMAYPATGSVFGWSTLGVRQGTRIRFEVGGTETERVVSLLERLLGFAGPEATGQSYAQFHSSVGVSTPQVEALEQRRLESSRWDRFRKAIGGRGARGQYIVNEIGREKFVPDRLAHAIPVDVAAQLPGNRDLMRQLQDESIHREEVQAARSRAGIFEIPGHGARVWEAPEDGWIIPARLAGKIPARHAGGPAGHGHDASGQHVRGPDGRLRSQQFLDNEELFRRSQQTAGEADPASKRFWERSAANEAAQAGRSQLRSASEQFRESFANIGGAGGRGGVDFNERFAQVRSEMALSRGLTGRAGLGGFFAGVLGGGQARRQAFAEAQELQRQYQSLSPVRGVDTLEAFKDQLTSLEDVLRTSEKEFEAYVKSGNATHKAIRGWGEELDSVREDITTARKAISDTQGLRLQIEERLNAAQGGAVRNIASLTAAGFAYTTAAQALQVGLELATTAARPFVDEITGFRSTATRVTQQLAQQSRQLGGDTAAAVGGAAQAAGVGTGALDFITRTLGPSISAKAGAAAAMEASDLFRASVGANGPQGLFGGFGGIGGGPLLAEFMGGGKGFTETIAGDVRAFRTQQQGLVGINAARGQGNVGRDLIGDLLFGTGSGGGIFPQRATAQEQARAYEVLRTELQSYNESVKRGADALGEHTTGLRLATREQLGLTEATDDALQEQLRQVGRGAGDEANAAELARQGVFLVDASNKIVASANQYQKFFQQAAQGAQVGTPEAFVAQQRRQLLAQRQLGAAQTQFALDVGIPGEAGLQIAAQPFVNAGIGVPRGPQAPLSQTALTNLREANKLQDDLTAGAKEAVQTMAQFVDQNVSVARGNEFRAIVGTPGAGPNTTTIAGIGEQIAAITAEVSDQQAKASYAAYANNIRLINRSLSDARGLLSGRGGANNLGVIQRQQFELSRQSQKLSLESQRLQLQSNELQLELSQRQINFQRAIAGFQAPGITGQERAARMAEAELEASFAQKQLDIGRQQQGISREQLGISGEQLGLELRAFTESARRAVVDLEAQRALVTQQYQLEQEQIVAQRRINALTVRQGQLQAKASAIFAEATGNFNAQLAAGAQYVAMFGGTLAAAAKVIRQALTTRPGTVGGPNTFPGNQTPHAAGYSAYVDKPTSFVAGDAGGEQVFVIRNPTTGSIGPSGGGGGGWMGGQPSLTINISGNQFGANLSETEIARTLADEVERRLETKARLLSVR